MKNKQLQDVYSALTSVLGPDQMRWEESVSQYTTFKIGGPADLCLLPADKAEVAAVMRVLTKYGVTPIVLGGGSNVLVLDGGIRGVLLCLCNLRSTLTVTENCITASAGIGLKEVSQYAKQEGLTGVEFAVGIPGTIGGAVFMNAGAYGGEMKHIVKTVRTVDTQGHLREYTNQACNFGYRHSLFQDNGEVIVEVDIQLAPGSKAAIASVMDDLTQKRESKQPLEYASAGSTFKRPPGYFAGTLIEETGLKGFTVGDAQISEKHAGFVINRGTATAENVLDLIQAVQRRIREVHGVQLETEVRILGEKNN